MTFLEEIEKLGSKEPNNMELGKQIRALFSKEDKWIYERNPDTNQIFRRRPGEGHEKRQEVDSDLNLIAKQLELF